MRMLWLPLLLLIQLYSQSVSAFLSLQYSLRYNKQSLRDKVEIDESLSSAVIKQLASDDVSFIDVIRSSQQSAEHSAADSSSNGFSVNDLDSSKFGALFRQCAPYITKHRGSVVVLHINGKIFRDPAVLDGVIGDIAILHLLGVHLVLVAGVKELLNDRMQATGRVIRSHEGIRITDKETLKDIKELSGFARFEIESSLARGFPGKPGNSGINVVSGNFFYTAKPLGVRGGVDYQFSGEVRRIEVENMRRRMEQGDVVMVTSLGYSPSGEVFSVASDHLAAECAAQLEASKLIYWTEGEVMIDARTNTTLQSLSLKQATKLVDRWRATTTLEPGWAETDADLMRVMEKAVLALSRGVRRAHFIPPHKGTLLKELYTRDGTGILVSRDVYEGIRQAEAADVRAVAELIRPLEQEGILVPRSRDQLEKDMPDCFLLARDAAVLACGMLKKYSDTHGEICCLAVHPANRRAGRGETLLAYLERRALLLGMTHLFILSTRTMLWFEERGFVASDPALLPEARKYDHSRGSKVYIKLLGSQRDVDEEEVLWNL